MKLLGGDEMLKFTNWYGTLWERILPHYLDTFWRTQYIYGRDWCRVETELIKRNHLKEEMKRIELENRKDWSPPNYYPPAA